VSTGHSIISNFGNYFSLRIVLLFLNLFQFVSCKALKTFLKLLIHWSINSCEFLCFYRATIKRHCSTQIDKSSRTLGEQNRWQNRPCVTFGPAALCLHPLIANPIKHHRQNHPSRLPTDPPTFFDRRKFASSLTTTATFRGIIVHIQFC
jgi:hypothetical protein